MQEFTIKQTILDYRSKEAFKTLRTNIEFSGEDTKVIFLTSTTPNEGKSTVSFELAQSFAQNGMKTLRMSAVEYALKGITTVEEVRRVAYENEDD